ncbi:MAG: membrane protein, partial [Algoriphagus marincola HL-49]
ILSGKSICAQTNIQGSITEAHTEKPLAFVAISLVKDGDGILHTISDSSGHFKFDGLAPGTYSLHFQHIGFLPEVIEVTLISGKDEIMAIKMKESIATLSEVVVKPNQNPNQPDNQMVLISGRGFNPDDTRRFAGSLNDPSRMATSLAGVSSANDFRNDIIIRGNSPSGLLWRIEGLDIPNPNHFASMGNTGGPVSLLNINVLSKSDFIIGAFPSEYGNALSGVFDLSLRDGNNEDREHTFQVGFNGLELGMEGPIGKNGGSYLANYRYSTVELLGMLGIDFGTDGAIPKYQDISFNVNLPTKKAGTFKLFGIGGTSQINFKADPPDSLSPIGSDISSGSNIAVLGFNHKILLQNDWASSISLGVAYSDQFSRIDSVNWSFNSQAPIFREKLSEVRTSLHWTLNKKINHRNYFRTGLVASNIHFNLSDSIRYQNSLMDRINSRGNTHQVQLHTQWKHYFTENLVASFGLHSLFFALNKQVNIEPRANISWEFYSGHFLKFGYGRHSQRQPLNLHFYQDPAGLFPNELTNRNLGFSKSDHYIVAYEFQMDKPWRFVLEAYYQNLFSIPVSRTSSYSAINAGAEFGISAEESLINKGQGRNVGIDLSVERSFKDGYYFLSTTSVFDSKYQDFADSWHNTAFNTNFQSNLLLGKQFKLKGRDLIAIDVQHTWAGGRRYTPIDLELSQATGEAVFENHTPFSKQFRSYYRLDLKVTYRSNGKKAMQEWAVDLRNITNRKNAFTQQFDSIENRITTIYQIGFFPTIFYRLYF